MQVHRAHDEIVGSGSAVIAIATGAVYQAKGLEDEGIGFPCLVDPTSVAYRTLGIGRLSYIDFLRPSGALNYMKAILRGSRQGAIKGDHRQLPGLAITDADAQTLWVRSGRVVGDYPPLTEVVARLKEAAAP